MAAIHLIGVPLDLGGGRRGVDMGPSAVRIAGIAERLTALGHHVQDRGDIITPTPETREPGDPKKRYAHEIAEVCEALYAQVLDTHSVGAFPIVIGGDHSLGAGSVAASATHAKRQGRPLGPHLGGCTCGHEHARDDPVGQCPRHATGGAAR